jgi:hypothetical protein
MRRRGHDDPPPAACPAGGPWGDLIDRIAEETELGGAVGVADGPIPVPAHPASCPDGAEACTRLVAGLRPRFLGRDGWTFSYRREAGAPVFVVTAGGGPGRAAAGCFLDLTPGIAPEAFARLITTLDGYGLGFRAELRGDPAASDRVGPAVVTVARPHVTAVARVALRMRERCPLLFGSSVAAFTRPVAPGIGLADEPPDGTGFARHRARLIATGLLAAGPGAGPVERRTAVRRALTAAGLDLTALHLNPGSPEFAI